MHAEHLSTKQQQLLADHAHIVPAIAKQLVKRFSLPAALLLKTRADQQRNVRSLSELHLDAHLSCPDGSRWEAKP